MYEKQTEEIIKKRMFDRVSNDIYKGEGSLTNDAIAPTSIEIAMAYTELDRVLQLVFAKTSHGEYLERRAEEFGIYRRKGNIASKYIVFEGSDGTIIYKDNIVQTETGLKYKTINEGTIQNGSCIIKVEALEPGSEYNLPSNNNFYTPIQITGVTRIYNPESIDGGTDEECDEELLNRLLLNARRTSTSGNINHYREWAMKVDGVGDVKIFPTFYGPGTIKVIVINDNKGAADDELIKKVKENIEANRPMGAVVTVDTAKAVNIDIEGSVIKDKEYTVEQIKTNISNRVLEYLQDIAFKQNYVSFAQIGRLILSSEGVSDYINSSLKINNDIRNINIQEDEVAVLGKVIINE